MISLYDILKAASGQLFGEPVAQIFTDFCLDPQQAREGLLYVALRSPRGDTHQYIEEAIQNGASGVLCMGPPECDTSGVSVLMVRDTVDALLSWSHFVLGKTGVKTIAVAGSTGKSATAAAVARVLSTQYSVLLGNVNDDGRLSIPLSLPALRPDHQFVVLKVDPVQPGDMQYIVEAIQPHTGIITDVDCNHAAAFDTCQQYMDELFVLVDSLRSPESLLVVNFDNERTPQILSRARCAVKTIGINQFGDMTAYNVNVGLQGTGFDLRYDERYLGRWSPVPGKHHLYGVLMGLMVGTNYSVPVEEALRSLTELRPLPGRMNPLEGKEGAILIDDTFRANVSSTLAALDWLHDVKVEGQRTIFILGDMDNLGKGNPQGHRRVGTRAAEVADIIITQGSQAALAGRAAIDQGRDADQVRMTYSVQDTIAILQEFNINQKDILLFKGGEIARMEQVVRAFLAHDDDAKHLVRQGASANTSLLPGRSLSTSWLEIDEDALAGNVRQLKSLLNQDVTLMAVVKADGYGHGMLRVARTALLNGATYLGVANIMEALTLRDAGIEAPILVLSYVPTHAVRQAIQQDITVTVFDLEQARQYERASRDIQGNLKYHVKVDTGMGRLGAMPDEVVGLFRYLAAMKNLDLNGIYTHFSTADTDADYVAEQAKVFRNLLKMLRAAGFQFKYVHAANSAALLRSNDYHFNMVRPGLVMYGLKPDTMTLPSGIKSLLTWKTVVLQVKTLPPGHPVGYGNTYTTRSTERIAILPIGYADGLRRAPQTWREVLIRGQRVPLIGRISMEKCAVNVSALSAVHAGDEVVLLGKQGDDEIGVEEVANWLNTSNYEVVTSVLARVPR
jgi:alanine racemase